MGIPKYINVGGKLLDLSGAKVMGIINVTPDSFFTGSRVEDEKALLGNVAKMLEGGADIIDVGGCSTRPGAPFAPADVEEGRVIGALRLINREFGDIVVSVDTFRAEIAKKAVLEYGVKIINDISGGELDKGMFAAVAELNVPYVLSHWLEKPIDLKPGGMVPSILKWLGERVSFLCSKGVKDIIIDPGFGFGKTLEQNFEILDGLRSLREIELPLMVGLSRKSMIWKSLDIIPEQALNGTTVLNTVAVANGANIIRVHDVKEAVEAVKLLERLSLKR